MMEKTLRIIKKIDNDRIGEVIWESVNEIDNSFSDIGFYLKDVLENICKSDRDYHMVNNTLIAITGYSLNSIVEKIQ